MGKPEEIRHRCVVRRVFQSAGGKEDTGRQVPVFFCVFGFELKNHAVVPKQGGAGNEVTIEQSRGFNKSIGDEESSERVADEGPFPGNRAVVFVEVRDDFIGKGFKKLSRSAGTRGGNAMFFEVTGFCGRQNEGAFLLPLFGRFDFKIDANGNDVGNFAAKAQQARRFPERASEGKGIEAEEDTAGFVSGLIIRREANLETNVPFQCD